METGSARVQRLRANALDLLETANRIQEDELLEPRGDDACIWFRKQFHASGTVYTYAAVRAGARWYTTNSSNYKTGPWDWAYLLEWIRSGATYEIWVVSEYTPMESSDRSASKPLDETKRIGF